MFQHVVTMKPVMICEGPTLWWSVMRVIGVHLRDVPCLRPYQNQFRAGREDTYEMMMWKVCDPGHRLFRLCVQSQWAQEGMWNGFCIEIETNDKRHASTIDNDLTTHEEWTIGLLD